MKKGSRLTAELLEMAHDMHTVGLLTDTALANIRKRHTERATALDHLSPPGKGLIAKQSV